MEDAGSFAEKHVPIDSTSPLPPCLLDLYSATRTPQAQGSPGLTCCSQPRNMQPFGQDLSTISLCGQFELCIKAYVLFENDTPKITTWYNTALAIAGVTHQNAKFVSKKPVRVFHAVVGARARLSLRTYQTQKTTGAKSVRHNSINNLLTFSTGPR